MMVVISTSTYSVNFLMPIFWFFLLTTHNEANLAGQCRGHFIPSNSKGTWQSSEKHFMQDGLFKGESEALTIGHAKFWNLRFDQILFDFDLEKTIIMDSRKIGLSNKLLSDLEEALVMSLLFCLLSYSSSMNSTPRGLTEMS